MHQVAISEKAESWTLKVDMRQKWWPGRGGITIIVYLDHHYRAIRYAKIGSKSEKSEVEVAEMRDSEMEAEENGTTSDHLEHYYYILEISPIFMQR